jgi:single-strand DNA-binding protein
VSELKLPSVNRILIAGRLTRDPEVRYTQGGTAVATLGVASSRSYRDPKDPAGGWKEETCFVNVVTWAQLAERCGDSLKKGSAVFVEGRLQSRSWETEDGNRRTVVEIRADRVLFLDKRGGGEAQPVSARGGDVAEDEGGVADDDLPF